MKITTRQIMEGEDELILCYKERNAEVEAILHFVENQSTRLEGIKDGEESGRILLIPAQVFYFESVDGELFAYGEEDVYRVQAGLQEILSRYEASGFFRCSRTMAVNIYKMERLKSEPAGKILATLSNGEEILISRKYAKQLRNILRNGREERS